MVETLNTNWIPEFGQPHMQVTNRLDTAKPKNKRLTSSATRYLACLYTISFFIQDALKLFDWLIVNEKLLS